MLVLTGSAKGGNLDGKDGVRTGDVGSDVDRSGSVSPTKSDRKLATKKPSFKPVSLNRAFLGEAPATTTAPTSTASALQSKGTTAPPSCTTIAIKVIVLTYSVGMSLGTGLSQTAPRPMATSKLKLTRSGSSSQPSRPTLGSGGVGSGSGNTQPVWNKNQRMWTLRPIFCGPWKGLTRIATPPPPKKEFTDEELSKKYGIHLASRLGSDDTTNKEAKWADIDDDDDDWVPTAIEWNDGMKASIPDAPLVIPTPDPVVEPVEEPVKPPAKEPAKEPIRDAIRELVKNTLQPQTLSVKAPAAPAKELLALGSGGHKTLVTQKPGAKTLQTTTAPPAVRQSPWAKLPPINPAPPVQVSSSLPPRRPLDNAPPREQPHREQPHREPPRREPPHREPPHREPPAVREVSAEVYDRSWRDRNSAHGNRELFNSQTGKMEPVPDDRRPVHSPVPKPAVLQRPIGPHQPTGGPAEPSAAFQTGRTSHRPDDFRRRRTSSNVSGGSGSVGRRLSFTHYAGGDPPTPDDMGFARDRSMYSNPFDEHGPPQRQYGGYGSHHIQPPFQGHKEMSPTMTHASPVTRPIGPHSLDPVAPKDEPEAVPQIQPETQPHPLKIPEESAEDLLAKQERVMREAREMALKRKKEEEEREEAAKKERLRVKLEALERLANEKEATRKAEEERERIAKEKREAEEAEKRLAEDRERALARERASAKATAEAEARVKLQQKPSSPHNDPLPTIPGERPNFVDRYVRQPSFASPTAQTSTLSPSSSTLSHRHTLHPSSTHNSSYLHTTTYRPPHLAPHSPSLSTMAPNHLGENTTGMCNNSIGSNNSGNNFSGNNNGYPGNNRNPAWKGGVTNPRGNTQWGSTQSSSPWGAIGDGSRPGVNNVNHNNMAGNVMNNHTNNRPTFDGPRPGHDGPRSGHDGPRPSHDGTRYNNGNGPRYNGNRANGGNGYNNYGGGGGYNKGNGSGGYGNRHRGDRQGDRRTPSPIIGPLGEISKEDRDMAVNRWNMLPGEINAKDTAARESNRAARLAREAEEAATGIKQQPQGFNYRIIEEFLEYRIEDTGSGVDRTFVARTVNERNEAGALNITETPKVDTGSIKSEEPNKLAAILMTHNQHHCKLDKAGSESHKAADVSRIGKLPDNTIAIPKGPAGTKPSRFFPTQANKTIAEHIVNNMKQNEEISKPVDVKSGYGGCRKPDNQVQRSLSPPPPMSADHPVHGTTKAARVHLPSGASMHIGGDESGHTVKRFEEVQRRILAGVPGHITPATLSHPTTKEGRNLITAASKPSYEEPPERQLKMPTVSLPCEIDETAGDASMLTMPDSEQFNTEFFQQDFGSTPNVKIPRPLAHAYDVPAADNGRNVAKRAAFKDGVQSVPLYYPFGSKDFTNGQGEKFLPVQVPGGTRKEVPYNGQLSFPGYGGGGGGGDKRPGRGAAKKRGGGRGGYNGGFGRKKAIEA